METKVLEKADSEEHLVPPDRRTGDGEGKWGSKSPPEGDSEGGRGVPESVEAIAVLARRETLDGNRPRRAEPRWLRVHAADARPSNERPVFVYESSAIFHLVMVDPRRQ